MISVEGVQILPESHHEESVGRNQVVLERCRSRSRKMYFMMELGKRIKKTNTMKRERGPFLQERKKYQHVTCFRISEHCKDYVLFCSSFHPDADDVFMFCIAFINCLLFLCVTFQKKSTLQLERLKYYLCDKKATMQ